MGLGLIDKIPDFKFSNIPIGNAIRGLTAWGLGDVGALVINRYMPTRKKANGEVVPLLPVGATKIGLALLFQEGHVKATLGPVSSNIGSLLLTMDGINSLFDLRGKVRNNAFTAINKFLPPPKPKTSGEAGGVTVIPARQPGLPDW